MSTGGRRAALLVLLWVVLGPPVPLTAQTDDVCLGCHDDPSLSMERQGREISLHVDSTILERSSHAGLTCTGCHAGLDPESIPHRDPIVPVDCAACHGEGEEIHRFHAGVALRQPEAAITCTDCHGFHDIRPSSDPASRVHTANLSATCGRCHEGADEGFAMAAVHGVATETGERVLLWIARIYICIIVVVVGLMLAHNGLDLIHKSRRRLRARRGAEETRPVREMRATEKARCVEQARRAEDERNGSGGQDLYLRMTLSERLQHGVLALSFIVLVVTGIMMHYPGASWVEAIRRLSAPLFELRSVLHQWAGAVMIGVSLYHAGQVCLTRRGRRFLRNIRPRRQDLSDLAVVVSRDLGLRSEGPLFGRFGYVEKCEYWAVVWGTVIMTLTGIILWFMVPSITLLTKFGFDVARTIHFYEAWLGILAIFGWHIYHVILNPDVFPMNRTWLTGSMSAAEMAEQHPLELAALRGRPAPGAPTADAQDHPQEEDSPAKRNPGT